MRNVWQEPNKLGVVPILRRGRHIVGPERTKVKSFGTKFRSRSHRILVYVEVTSGATAANSTRTRCRAGGDRPRCGIGLLGGQYLRMADYVTVTAPTGEAVAAGCC